MKLTKSTYDNPNSVAIDGRGGYYLLPRHWHTDNYEAISDDGRIIGHINYYRNNKLVARVVGREDNYMRKPIVRIIR